MTTVVMSVQPVPVGAVAMCSICGPLSLWAEPALAAWSAIGHANTHHTGAPS